MEALIAQQLKPSEILAALGAVKNAFGSYYERTDTANDNRDDLHRILYSYQLLNDTMQRLQQSLSAFDHVSQNQIRVHARTVADNERTLHALQAEVENAKVTDRVKRMKKILEDCESRSETIMQFLSTQVVPVLREMEKSSPQNNYVADNNVPPNAPRLTLDYNTTCTCEGQLKAAVMNEGGSRVVGVVAIGMGGVGKTCALRGLADDTDIKNRFPGGLLYIQLGNNARLSTIIQRIANLVEGTGNPPLAVQVIGQESLQKATEKASLWFRRETCLFLIDDIWLAHGINSSVLSVLTRLLGERSRLIYTTRDKQFMAVSEKVIEFSAKETQGEMARRMLMKHAGFDWKRTLSERNEEAVRGILELCCGLPLALGVVGETVRKESRGRLDEKESTWKHVYDRIHLRTESIVDEDAEAYGAVRMIVDASLELLQCENRDIRFEELFRAQCVVEKQQMVPIHMLRNLWGFQDLTVAAYVVEKLDEVNLVHRLLDGSVVLIQLHDVILDIAIRKASERHEVKKVWKSLVDNYIDEERGILEGRDVKAKSEDEVVAHCERKKMGWMGWYWKLCCLNVNDVTSDEVADEGAVKQEGVHEQPDNGSKMWAWWMTENDGYIHGNVCRALRGAGYEKQLLWLVPQPQWIVSRLQNSGIVAVEQDIGITKAVARSMSHNCEDLCRHMEMVRKAARLGYRQVINNKQEAWFQIHGRLLLYASKCERTRQFVEEIEQCAPRPWAKASIGFLEQAGAATEEVIRCGNSPLSLRIREGRVAYFFEGADRRFVLSQYSFATGEIESYACDMKEYFRPLDCPYECDISYHLKTVVMVIGNVIRPRTGKFAGRKVVWWNVETSEKVEWFEDTVACISFSPDGNRIVSGSEEGTLQVRELKSGEPMGESLVGHSKAVTCVAWSGDGKRLVSGSMDYTVRVWEVEGGKLVGEPLIGHTSEVTCVACSADGGRVASGSRDRTVRVWEVGSAKPVRQPLVGHTNEVRCVALSGDEERVVSWSHDCSVRVWEVESGVPIGNPVVGHTLWVICIAWSEDQRRVVSGSEDQTVRVWELQTGERDGGPLVGHTGLVSCVARSGDGKRVVSGSWNCTVRVWEVETGEPVGEPLVGHSQKVTCVSWSRDGSRVVSGSPDKTVRVWEVESGEPVGGPLVGHSEEVTCVGWSGDGRRVVSGSKDKTVRVWEVQTGEPVGEPFVGHEGRKDSTAIRFPFVLGWVECVALNSDGTHAVSGSDDRQVRVWEVESGELVGQPLVGSATELISVAFSRDGMRVACGASNGTVRVWEVGSGRGMRTAVPFVHRPVCLNDGSWRVQYYGEGDERTALTDHERGAPALTALIPRWSGELRFGNGGEDVLGTGDFASVRVGNWWLSRRGFTCRAEQ